MIDADAVDLELYAAVTVALGEGYSLPEVLEHEGLSLDTWETAEEQWIERLEESAEEDLALHDELDRALAKQRKRFSRSIDPLDVNLEQYLVFVHHFSRADHPVTFLNEHGLHLGDWIRLQESWAERIAADASLRENASQALASSQFPPVPVVNPASRAMPPPLRKRDAPFVVESAESEIIDSVEWGLDTLREPLPKQVEAGKADAEEKEPVDAPPMMLDDMGPAETSLAPRQTLPSGLVHHHEALPFSESARSSDISLNDLPRQTLPPVSRLPLRALPFDDRPGHGLSDSEATPNLSPEIEVVENNDVTATMTLSLQQFIPKPALPFRQAGGDEKPEMPVGDNADDPAATMFIMPGTVFTRPALPFQTAPEPARPMAENVIQDSVPQLSLEEHAALCARLAASRGDSELIFAQYGLSSRDVRRTVDALWKKRLEADSALYEKWQRSYRIFEARLRDASPKPRSG